MENVGRIIFEFLPILVLLLSMPSEESTWKRQNPPFVAWGIGLVTVFVSFYFLQQRPESVWSYAAGTIEGLVLHPFVHADHLHAAVNIFLWWIVSRPVEERVGTKQFMVIMGGSMIALGIFCGFKKYMHMPLSAILGLSFYVFICLGMLAFCLRRRYILSLLALLCIHIGAAWVLHFPLPSLIVHATGFVIGISTAYYHQFRIRQAESLTFKTIFQSFEEIVERGSLSQLMHITAEFMASPQSIACASPILVLRAADRLVDANELALVLPLLAATASRMDSSLLTERWWIRHATIACQVSGDPHAGIAILEEYLQLDLSSYSRDRVEQLKKEWMKH